MPCRPMVVERSRVLTFSRSWMWRSAVRISVSPILFQQINSSGDAAQAKRRWKRSRSNSTMEAEGGERKKGDRQANLVNGRVASLNSNA